MSQTDVDEMLARKAARGGGGGLTVETITDLDAGTPEGDSVIPYLETVATDIEATAFLDFADENRVGETLTVGSREYIVVDDGTAEPNSLEVNAGADAAAFAQACANVIGRDTLLTGCTVATQLGPPIRVILTANEAGSVGNSIVLETTAVDAIAITRPFSGGLDTGDRVKGTTVDTLLNNSDLAARVAALESV